MDAAQSLANACTHAIQNGLNFPGIWETLLRENALVASSPIQNYDEDQSHTDILLRNGYWLRYRMESNDFSLCRARLHRAF
jgi:hypothetical protein